jgi:hypothetical protein
MPWFRSVSAPSVASHPLSDDAQQLSTSSFLASTQLIAVPTL